MSYRVLLATLAALALSACAAPHAAQTFTRKPAACPPAIYYSPVWSGDGSRIFYTKRIGYGIEEIHSMNRSGGDDRLVVSGYVGWLSPGGKWLLYVVPRPKHPWGMRDFGLLDLTSMQSRMVDELGSVDWSPDGRWLIYSRLTGGPIKKLDPASGHEVVLADTPGQKVWNWDPMWSPDGRRIAFSSSRDGARSIYIMQADGSNITQVIGDNPVCPSDGTYASYGLQAWRPDGGALAYVITCHEYQEPKIVTLDGSDAGFQSHRYEGAIWLTWSHDGSHILLGEYIGGQTVLYVLNADGSDSQIVPGDAMFANWSPDGEHIVFTAEDQTGLSEIYVADPDGTHVVQLTSNPGAGICWH